MTTNVRRGLVAGAVFLGGVAVGRGQFPETKTDGKMDGKMEMKSVEKPALFDPQIEQLYRQAVLLFRSQRFDEAEANCRRILALKTNELNTVQLMKDITEARQHVPPYDPGAVMKKKLQEIILPDFRVVDGVAPDVVARLQQESGKCTADKIPVNLVWNAPASEKIPQISVTLFKMSLAEILQYLTEGNGLSFRVDEHAVVIGKNLQQVPGNSTTAVSPGTDGSPLRRKLRETILPRFQVSGAAVRDAVDHLQVEGGKVAADQTPFNVVWNVPADQAVAPVTLTLYRASLADVLRYLTELSGLRYRADERVVVISPAEPPSSPAIAHSSDVEAKPN